MSGCATVLCAQVLDILRAQSADELEEAVSEWTEVRPATAATAGFALMGKRRLRELFRDFKVAEDLRNGLAQNRERF